MTTVTDTPREGVNTMEGPTGNFITRDIERGWYTRRQAAERIGRDYDTLRRWERDGIAKPSGQKVAGKVTMPLYNMDDINALRKVVKAFRNGLPLPKTSE